MLGKSLFFLFTLMLIFNGNFLNADDKAIEKVQVDIGKLQAQLKEIRAEIDKMNVAIDLLNDSKKPTKIVSIAGNEVKIWPEKIPDWVVENWKSVVPIWVDVVSKDPNKPLPPKLSQSMWGTGFLVSGRDGLYIISVAHTFTTNLAQIMEVTKYTQSVLTVSGVLVEKYREVYVDGQLMGDFFGRSLELVAYESEPLDFAVFKVNLPVVNNGAIDWSNLGKVLPGISRCLRAAKPLRIASPSLDDNEPIYLSGYLPLEEDGMLPYQAINYLTMIVENLKFETGDRSVTLKKRYILKGQATRGLSGSFGFCEEGLAGILKKGTDDGSVLKLNSGEDLANFLKRHDLEFLIDKDSR